MGRADAEALGEGGRETHHAADDEFRFHRLLV
jgi:hypothetical protein